MPTIGGQYFPSQGRKRQTARRARMVQAEGVQRRALAGPGGFQGTQALSQSNRVSGQLLGGSSNRFDLVPGGGGAGGGGGYGADYDEARAANERRFKDILGGYKERYDRGIGTLDEIGAQEKADIIERGGNRATVGQQDMISRGLTGSTIAPSVARGYASDTEKELRRFSESQARLRLGTDADLSGDYLQFAERREDPYPDLGQYLKTAQAYGASGGGQPIYYGGYQSPGAGYFNVGGGAGQPQRPRPGPGGGGVGPVVPPGNGAPPPLDLPDWMLAGGGAGQPIRPGGPMMDVGGGGGQPQRPGGGGAVANVWDPREKQRLADFQRKFGHMSPEELKRNPEAQRFIEEQRRKYGGGTPGPGGLIRTKGGPVNRGYMTA